MYWKSPLLLAPSQTIHTVQKTRRKVDSDVRGALLLWLVRAHNILLTFLRRLVISFPTSQFVLFDASVSSPLDNFKIYNIYIQCVRENSRSRRREKKTFFILFFFFFLKFYTYINVLRPPVTAGTFKTVPLTGWYLPIRTFENIAFHYSDKPPRPPPVMYPPRTQHAFIHLWHYYINFTLGVLRVLDSLSL